MPISQLPSARNRKLSIKRAGPTLAAMISNAGARSTTNSAKVSGAKGSFSLAGKWSSWINIRHEIGRVNLISSWNEHNIYAEILKHIQVMWQIAWIASEVFMRTKLCWINEYTRGKDLVLFSSMAHERKMSLVKISHGKDNSDFFGASATRALSHHLLDCGDYSHPSSAPVSTRSCRATGGCKAPLSYFPKYTIGVYSLQLKY